MNAGELAQDRSHWDAALRHDTNPQADAGHMETGSQACGDHVEIKA